MNEEQSNVDINDLVTMLGSKDISFLRLQGRANRLEERVTELDARLESLDAVLSGIDTGDEVDLEDHVNPEDHFALGDEVDDDA